MKDFFCNLAVVAVGVANSFDLVFMLAGVHCMFLKNLFNFVVSIIQTGVGCSWSYRVEWLDLLNIDHVLVPAVWLLKN